MRSCLWLLVVIGFAAVGQPARATVLVACSADEMESLAHGTFTGAPCAVIVSTDKSSPPPAAEKVPEEMTFSFANWTLAEEDSIRQYLTWVLPLVTERLGYPAYPNHVVIRYDPQMPYSAAYFTGPNEIRFSFAPSPNASAAATFLSTLIHELTHAWRDDFVVWASAYEEGLARAIEVRLMDEMPPSYRSSFWDKGHYYYLDVLEELNNSPAVACRWWSQGLSAHAMRRYALAGWLFWRIEEASQGSFQEAFHAAYVAQCWQDPNFPQNLTGIRQLMQSLQPVIDGTPAAEYWERHSIMEVDLPLGEQVYILGDKVGASAYVRTSSGESPMEGVVVEWSVEDADGVILAEGSLATSAYGHAFPTVSLPVGTNKRGIARYRVHLPQTGTVEREQALWLRPSMPLQYTGYGLFGIVEGTASQLTIESLDGGGFSATVPVTSGEFRCQALEGVKGLFHVLVNGRERIIRKDTASYLVLLNDETTQPVAIADLSPPDVSPALGQNAPNPFEVSTTIPFFLEREGPVRLTIYAVTGRAVRTLANESLPAGRHAVRWNGRDENGAKVSPGAYFYRLENPEGAKSHTLQLIR